MTLVYCMYNKYVDSYKILDFHFNKVNTSAPFFHIMDLLNIFEVFCQTEEVQETDENEI